MDNLEAYIKFKKWVSSCLGYGFGFAALERMRERGKGENGFRLLRERLWGERFNEMERGKRVFTPSESRGERIRSEIWF